MELVKLLFQIAANTMGSLWMVKCMEKEFLNGKVINQEKEINAMMGSISSVRNMGREGLRFPLEIYMMGNGLVALERAMDFWLIKMVYSYRKEFGIKVNF